MKQFGSMVANSDLAVNPSAILSPLGRSGAATRTEPAHSRQM